MFQEKKIKRKLAYEKTCYAFSYFSFTRSVYEEIYPNSCERHNLILNYGNRIYFAIFLEKFQRRFV